MAIFVCQVKPVLFGWGESYSSLSQSYDYAYPEYPPCWSLPTPGGPNANCVDLRYPPPPAPVFWPPPPFAVLRSVPTMPNLPPPLLLEDEPGTNSNIGLVRLLGILGLALLCCCAIFIIFNWRGGPKSRARPIFGRSLPVTAAVVANSNQESTAATSSTSDEEPPQVPLAERCRGPNADSRVESSTVEASCPSNERTCRE